MMLGSALYQIVYEKNGRLSGLPFFFGWDRFSKLLRLVYRSVVKATLSSVCWPKLSITMNFNSEGLSLMLR